jgi:hypothetical protein
MAESGIDQSYDIIKQNVDFAIKEGNKKVSENIKAFIDQETNKELNGTDSIFINDTTFEPVKDAIDKIIQQKETATYDPQSKLYNAWYGEFKTAYKTYLQNNLIAELKTVNNYQAVNSSISSDKPAIGIVNEAALAALLDDDNKPSIFGTSNSCDITLTSSFKPTTGNKPIEQKIQVTLHVVVPDKIPGDYYADNDLSEGKINAIFANALTASKNIIMRNSNAVTINGNIYAKGERDKDGTGEDTKYMNSFGGVSLEGNDTNVTVNGDITTDANVQVKNPGNACKLYVKNAGTTSLGIFPGGNVFADNLCINTGCTGSEINIAEDLITMDDIELNGRASSINITGGYYGFSCGEYSLKPNNSSGIIIITDTK